LIRTVLALAAALTAQAEPKPYPALLHDFLQETRNRIMRRSRRLVFGPTPRKEDSVDGRRELKGLERMP
jgi:hypothetical protein